MKNFNSTFAFSLIICLALSFSKVHAQVIKPENYYWTSKPEEIKANEKFADASAVILKDMRFYNFFYEKSKEAELQCFTITHKIIQINDTRAIESYNRIYISLGGVIDISDIRSRVISPAGKVTELNKDNIKELDNKEGEGSYKIFAVEGLEKGSRLEYYYKLKKSVDYSFRIGVGGTVPVQFSQVQVVCPENLTYEHKTYNGQSEAIDTIIDERRYVILTSKNIAGREDETYSAYSNELMRHEWQLAYNTAAGKSRILSYNSVIQRMYPGYYEEDTKATKKIQKLAEELKLSKLSTDVKIRTIENYVKTNIREIKGGGEVYSDISRILQDKIASNTGLIRLYIHLLRTCEIPVQVVYTTDRDDAAFDPDFETWNYLDEIILYFPDTDKYLDPSAIVLRYPMIPTIYQLNHGLFMEELVVGNFKSATGTIKKIPADAVASNSEVMDIFCKFNKSLDSVYIKQTRSFLGILASNTRFSYNYSEPDDKKKITDDLMKFGMKDGKVIKCEVKNYDFMDQNKPLEVTGEVGGSSLLEKTGKEFLFKIGEVIGPQTELYQEKERQCNIDMFYAHHYKRTIKVEIPVGYKLTGLDALKIDIRFNFEGKDACGFVSEYKIEGNTLTVTANEYYNVIQLPKEQFDNFRKVINAAADFNKVNIVIEKI